MSDAGRRRILVLDRTTHRRAAMPDADPILRSDEERLTIPDVPVDNGEPGMPSGGGGGGQPKIWVISGRLQVRETEIDGDLHDRDLIGVEVEVSASDLGADGPWTQWGTTRTSRTGEFSLREQNAGKSRFLRVRARLVGSDLEVNESKLDDLASFDLLDTNWRIVWKSERQLEGPNVAVGTRRFASGGGWDLGNETFRRQALIWYVLRTTIDRLVAEDSWFAIGHKIAAIYPAHAIGGTSYANGLTRMIYLHQGKPDTHWHPDTVIHEFIHLWNYAHNHGTINWVGAVCSLRGDDPVDLTTHNVQENPSVAFAEGFSNWAANALLHELWGLRLARPFNRRHVVRELGLPTLEQVEKSDYGVDGALRLLHCDDGAGWWSHLFGTADTVPDRRPDDDGNGVADFASETGVAPLTQRVVPPGPDHLALWDVLRVFRANPGRGWDTDWQVGNVDYGIVRFIDRACDIHRLGDDVRQMLKRSIDPLATDEPRDALAKAAA